VCSVDGIKHRLADSAFVLLLVFATIPAILGLSGCAGLVSATNSTGAPGALSANPSTISFGDVSVGNSATQSLSVTNTGTATVSISAATISGTNLTFVGGSSSIPAGQSSTIQIQFAPQSVGDVAGSFSVASNASNSPLSVSLKGRGKSPRLTVSPTSLNFGNVTVGQTSTQNAQLTNSGNADLVVNLATVLGNGIAISGLSLPTTIIAGQSVGFAVQFAPTTAGAVSGSISFANNGSGSPYTLPIAGSGVAATVAPSITTQPISQAVTVGQTASFSVVATGTAPLSYQWRKNSVAIAGATSSSYTTPVTTSSDNGAQFSVLVSNTAGNVTSSAATLTVNAATVAPSITTQPISQAVTVGQTASFSVVAAGTAPLSYQWEKNSVAIAGATSSSYTTPVTTSSDNGAQFSVVVSNTAGNVTSSAATLTVSAATVAPSITTQPISQTVTVGQTASFSVVATGTAPLSYQWQKNSVAIAGATSSSYTTPATTSSDNGAQFSVLVSNTAGNVTSSATTLTVNASQISPVPTNVGFGNVVTATTSTQTITLTNSGAASLTISQASVSGPGFSISGLTVPATIAAGKSITFNAVFAPNTSGSVTGSISLLSNAPNSPLAIPLSGSGVAATFILGANPTSLSFGNVNIGSSSSLGATLTNNGNSNVTISSVTLTGTGLSASGVTSGTVLVPSQSATLTVAFAPMVALSVSGSVNVISNATNSPAIISLTGTGVTPVASAFPVWVQSSLVRVGKTDAAGTTSSINLSSARGETVDTQVIVQAPAAGLSNVNLSSSVLTGPAGATIPASNVTLYREYYLSVTGTANYGGGSNPPLGSGAYPEPLIPFNDPETGSPLCGTAATLKACNAAISGGQNQPYWIDISVPRGPVNSPPGTYTGTISVTATQGTVTIPVALTVWNFELPLQPSEASLWTLWPPAAGNTTTTLGQALMRNKVMGWYDVAANASPDIANFGLNRSGLDSYYFIGIQCNGSFSSIPSTSQINAAAANFPAGLALDFYLADELNGCTADYSPIKTMGTNAHAANRSVKTMMTINAVDSNLYGAIDHWVLLDSVQQWPALPFTHGDLWSYTSCNAGFGNAPEWMVDYPPINERIQAGFLNWTQGATGILYYRSDGWTAGNTIGSWNNVDTTACGGGLGRPGDGIFLYPPGPIASTESAPGIRLKAIRDGIQDYEYAQILKNLGQVPLVNSIVVPIATSWSNWSHDPNALENARLQLGQQLHLLAP
jgi:hypothetical protein